MSARGVVINRSTSRIPVGLVTLISLSMPPITSIPTKKSPSARKAGAKASQITSVLYLGHRAKLEPQQGLEPDYVIKSLGELLRLLPTRASKITEN